MKYKELRKKYSRFIYQKYTYKISDNNLEIFFDFLIEPGIFFRPKITISNVDPNTIKRVGEGIFNNLIFHLGLMEIPSYWKATCAPRIEIEAGYLNKEQIKWWRDLIINGMGQFFYENKIDFRKPDFLKIIINKDRAINNLNNAFQKSLINNRFLIPMGEGKDSIITLEFLKNAKKQINCLLVNPSKEHLKVLKVDGLKNPIIMKRKIDPLLLKLNQKGYLNGHTPITALISNLALLAAVLFNFKNIVMSCERSSNEGNVRYLGKIINHQYSKSFNFERKFRNYSKKYLAKNIEYFSFLRPLYEIQIARIFSQYPQYFSVFSSCNLSQKTGQRWCNSCPKCLFVYAILYPFLSKKQLFKIFSEELFEKKELLPIMKELIGERKFKPFECVGTKKESLVAFFLSWEKANEMGEKPYLLKYFQRKILSKYPNLKRESRKILSSWNKQHNLPKEFEKSLKKMVS